MRIRGRVRIQYSRGPDRPGCGLHDRHRCTDRRRLRRGPGQGSSGLTAIRAELAGRTRLPGFREAQPDLREPDVTIRRGSVCAGDCQ